MTPNELLRPFRHAVSQLMPLALLVAACGSPEVMAPAGPNDPDASLCLSNRDFFAKKAWPAVFGKTCIACHAPGGVAVESDAAFRLLPASYPGFIDANFAAVSEIARHEFDGLSLLLAKPSAKTMHGGGMVLSEGSGEYAIVEQLIKRLRDGDPCPNAAAPTDFEGVQLLDSRETYRKASLSLAGRLPSDDELTQLDQDAEAALTPLLDQLMHEEAFYERLKEMFNDVFLSDRYYRNDDAVNLLNRDEYPRVGEWYEAQTDEARGAINRAIAREPLELIAHIVRNGKPFTEVLTADYTVVNPYSAQLYGLQLDFADPSNEGEWQEAQVSVVRDGTGVGLPHAGILTNPIWLNRFPTSETNRNRHRARMVLQQFLATDILKVAERPVDALASTKYDDLTRDDPTCASCHRQLDPIAGAFMKWDDDDQEEFVPEREWHRDMFAPGFSDELIPVESYGQAQQWLAQRIVEDPRFALSVVCQMYTALTGHQPLEYPSQMLMDYDAMLSAWEAQERAFRGLSDAFVASNHDLRAVIRGIVLSPYFRAKNLTSAPSDIKPIALTDLGTGRLSMPELLDRKINAVLGVRWRRDYDREPYLRGDYQIIYGGIDSNTTTTRLTHVNSVMSGVQWRMANEMACAVTPWEISRPSEERTLFPYVDIDTTPISADGSDNAEAIAAIKQNISHLHARFWGTQNAPDDPEVEATYSLFLQTWREGLQGVASKQISDRLPYACQTRRNLQTGVDLPEAERVSADPRYTVRAWMAVLTYLMSDYQFLYE